MTFKILLLALLSSLTFSTRYLAQDKNTQDTDRPKITISEETTYFTEPLNEHGEVDYWKALNTHYSKGVTPENNLVTAIVRLCGVDIENEIVRSRYFERLGIEDFPNKQGYLIEFEEFANEEIDEDEAYEISQQILKSPWSRLEFPLAADWIDKYSPAVDQYIVQLEKKTHYYDPLASVDELNEPAFAASYALMHARLIARFITARSLLKLESDDINGCIVDLDALRKTSHLLSNSPSLIELLTGYALAGICHDAEVQLCNHELVTIMHLKTYRHNVAKYQLKNRVAAAIRVDQRVLLLEVAMAVQRGDKGLITLLNLKSQLGASDFYKKANALVMRSVCRMVDWDNILRLVNAHIEKTASIFEDDSDLDCLIAAERFDSELELRFASHDSIDFLRRLLMSNGKTKDQLMFDMINSSFQIHDPGYQIFEAYCRTKAKQRLMDTNIALHLFKRENGKFPDKLDELVPLYCKSLPIDPYANEPMIYKTRKQHFVLYSVGHDREDNGGVIATYERSDIAITSDMKLWEHRDNN